jgi:hypothetical protein
MRKCFPYEYSRRREKDQKNLANKIIAENFLNLGKDTDIQVQEAQMTLAIFWI